MIPYINNKEILKFLNRAQNKIANLGSLLVERGGVHEDSLTLLLELSDFIECLDDKYNTWTEKDILRYIHTYNQRANLNAIPFLLVTGLEINIIQGGDGSGFGLPITTRDVSDYVPATNALIKKFPHNNLALIQPESGYQGEVAGERYHISKEMYDFLWNLMNPFTPPGVGLSLTATPNVEWQEKGTVVSMVALQGSIQLNSGKSVIKHRYKRIGRAPSELLVEARGGNVEGIVHREPVRVNTIFRFEADFEKGGTKTADRDIKFIAPMWFGLEQKGKSASDIQKLTKVVEGPNNPRNFNYNLPSNNTTVQEGQVVVPYLLVSKSRGTPSRFEVETFDTLPDWKITSAQATLQDGTKEDCWLCEFQNTVVGNYTYKVSWS